MSDSPSKPHYCNTCGYRLDHLAGSTCAECGTPFDLSDPKTFRHAPRPNPWPRLFKLGIVPLVFAAAWAAVISVQAPLLGLAVMTMLLMLAVSRKWWAYMAVILIVNPIMLEAGLAGARYFAGTAALQTQGVPPPTESSLHPDLLLTTESFGCGPGQPVARLYDAVNNATLATLVYTLGPMPGAYDGPYPTQAEAAAALKQSTTLQPSALYAGSFDINGQAIQLARHEGARLMNADEWSCMLEPELDAHAKTTGPITATVYQDRCLIVRVPRLDAQTQGYDAAEFFLIDVHTGRAFAHYLEGDTHSNFRITW